MKLLAWLAEWWAALIVGLLLAYLSMLVLVITGAVRIGPVYVVIGG